MDLKFSTFASEIEMPFYSASSHPNSTMINSTILHDRSWASTSLAATPIRPPARRWKSAVPL